MLKEFYAEKQRLNKKPRGWQYTVENNMLDENPYGCYIMGATGTSDGLHKDLLPSNCLERRIS